MTKLKQLVYNKTFSLGLEADAKLDFVRIKQKTAL
jgi:hypothetical protein